jgi:hypothetical protein
LTKLKKKSALWEGRPWEFFLLAKKNVQALQLYPAVHREVHGMRWKKV